MAEMGFGLNRDDIIRMGFLIAEKVGYKHPFKEGSAGQAWFDSFMSCHHQLTLRSPQPLSHTRARSASDDVVMGFFCF